MKIKVFEEICERFGGYYECDITDENRWLFVSWKTCSYVLFPDDLSEISSKAKKLGFTLQYIVGGSDGIELKFIKS